MSVVCYSRERETAAFCDGYQDDGEIAVEHSHPVWWWVMPGRCREGKRCSRVPCGPRRAVKRTANPPDTNGCNGGDFPDRVDLKYGYDCDFAAGSCRQRR